MVAFFKYGWKIGFFNKIAKISNKNVDEYICILFNNFCRNIGVLASFGSFQLYDVTPDFVSLHF